MGSTGENPPSTALTERFLPSAALTLRLPPIRGFVIAMDELIRVGLFGSPDAA